MSSSVERERIKSQPQMNKPEHMSIYIHKRAGEGKTFPDFRPSPLSESDDLLGLTVCACGFPRCILLSAGH